MTINEWNSVSTFTAWNLHSIKTSLYLIYFPTLCDHVITEVCSKKKNKTHKCLTHIWYLYYESFRMDFIQCAVINDLLIELFSINFLFKAFMHQEQPYLLSPSWGKHTSGVKEAPLTLLTYWCKIIMLPLALGTDVNVFLNDYSMHLYPLTIPPLVGSFYSCHRGVKMETITLFTCCVVTTLEGTKCSKLRTCKFGLKNKNLCHLRVFIIYQ